MLTVVHWAYVLRPFAECLPVQSSIESSYKFGVEILGYTKRGYNLDDQVLNIHSVFQCACNVMMYLSMI
jgi:hypothetical protein